MRCIPGERGRVFLHTCGAIFITLDAHFTLALDGLRHTPERIGLSLCLRFSSRESFFLACLCLGGFRL